MNKENKKGREGTATGGKEAEGERKPRRWRDLEEVGGKDLEEGTELGLERGKKGGSCRAEAEDRERERKGGGCAGWELEGKSWR